jgi:hypothetical protein
MTAGGVVLSVATQFVSMPNGDGTTTDCEVLGGELRTADGRLVTFAAGGVLTPTAGSAHGTLAPAAQEILDTLEHGADQGTLAIVTIVYDATEPLCGYDLADFVTAASLRAAPSPTPVPTPTPGPGATPRPAPRTTTATVTGTVVRMSPLGVLVQRGSDTCHVWPGRLRTAAGRTLDFAVETPLTGDLQHGGLEPTDPAAAPRAQRLVQAWVLRARAVATITHTGPIDACGEPLQAVVTAAAVTVTKQQTTRRTGRVRKLSAPRIASADGTSCRVWTGRLRTRSGPTIPIAVETALSGTRARAVDPRAARLVATLRRARANKRRATITSSGPVIACGETFDSVVHRVKLLR